MISFLTAQTEKNFGKICQKISRYKLVKTSDEFVTNVFLRFLAAALMRSFEINIFRFAMLMVKKIFQS